MKKAVRFISLILSCMFTASMLAGCSSKAEKSPANSNPADQKTTKLTFSMWDPMPEDNDFVASFMESNPNIEVEILSFPDENYSQKLNTMVATNSEPDVMLLWECDIPNFAKADKLVKLDDFISKSQQLSMEDMLPAMTSLQEMNGATYGLPWCFAVQLMYYNKDMFDAADVSYPTEDWTWQDYREAAKKLTIRDGEKVTQWGDAGLNHPGAWYSMIGAGGDDIISANGSIAIGEGAKQALQWQYDLIHTDKTSPEISAESGATDLFAAGRAAMFRTGSWMASAYRDVPFHWDIQTLPSGSRKYAGIHTGFFSISKNCKNPEAAWKFIEYCMSDAGQETIVKGFGNPSARLSLNEKGFHKVQGTNGPSNWDAFDQSAKISECGYTLLPAGVTSDLVKKFEAAVMGQENIDEALKSGLAEANKVIKH